MLEMYESYRLISPSFVGLSFSFFSFWILLLLKRWLETPLPESPQLCLLGDSSLLPLKVSKAESAPTFAGFIVVVRIIHRLWISQVRPGFADWSK